MRLFQQHHRAPAPALRGLHLRLARKSDLHILEHHAGQRAYAHPEHGPGTAQGDGRCHPCHAADAQRAGQRRKESVSARMISKHFAKAFPQLAKWDKPRKKQRAYDQRQRHPFSPEQRIQLREHFRQVIT